MQITLDGSSLTKVKGALEGKKMYIVLGFGMVVVALNHFGLLPQSVLETLQGDPNFKDVGLRPENWLIDEYKLLVGHAARAAIAKAGEQAK